MNKKRILTVISSIFFISPFVVSLFNPNIRETIAFADQISGGAIKYSIVSTLTTFTLYTLFQVIYSKGAVGKVKISSINFGLSLVSSLFYLLSALFIYSNISGDHFSSNLGLIIYTSIATTFCSTILFEYNLSNNFKPKSDLKEVYLQSIKDSQLISIFISSSVILICILLALVKPTLSYDVAVASLLIFWNMIYTVFFSRTITVELV